MKMILLTLLTVGITGSVMAQTKEKTNKEETITIRKKNDSKEKITIVIDGDKVTMNGKPIEDIKDADIEISHNGDYGPLLSKLRGRLAPNGGMKMFGEALANSGNRAFLGVVTEKTEKGVKITTIEKESAAEKTGLKKEDIITNVADTKIETSEDLYEAIGKYKPEDKVTITYLRDGKTNTATAVLGKSKASEARTYRFNNDNYNFNMPSLPEIKGMEFGFNRKPKLGMGIQDMEEGKGVKILDVDKETPSAKAGLQKDDIILEMDGQAVTSVDDLKNKVKGLKEGDSMKITYQRNGKTQTTDIRIPKKIKTADL